ncbi:hypothetical protein EUTSA_v10001129mg [Eutrema salsugineum]|uniref:F-box associated beta-propeller type 1 domain-containing protein n=1 Tax=Eutrema salsugineum TaxID=72664 RepID=V4LJ18_EUTSA|nr:hypothetical protein EUTSA_v10001129mg [Eutrema salsugineum]
MDNFTLEYMYLWRGDTYWFATDRYSETPEKGDPFFLVCFDFTRESFGYGLPLPLEWCPEDTVSLSSVREEQLTILFQREDPLQMEIWVTSKIDPNAVSWSSKMRVSSLTRRRKSLWFFDKDRYKATRNIAYIVGKDESLKEVVLRESPYKKC